MSDEIKVELIETNFLTRYPCHVCGGVTDKEPILAQVREGEYRGFTVCLNCITARDFASSMGEQAERLEQRARETRAAIGRLRVPSREEFDRAYLKSEVAYLRAQFPDCDVHDMARAAAREWMEQCRRALTNRTLERQEIAAIYGVTVQALDAAEAEIEREQPADADSEPLPF